jgi:pimeloyl-ACP methyl ester carboxylesterase
MKVYFISGLGADSRVFHHIHLPQGFEPVYLDWIKPLPNESLHAYACRLGDSIDDSQEFAIVGLSMGGMMAVEIAKLHRPVITVLISSVSCSAHLPFYFRIASRLRLHKLVPVSLLKSASFIKRFFTAEESEDKKLVRQLIRDTDPAFIRWAMHAVLQWDCKDFNGRYIHIHGSGDLILPPRFTKPTHIIRKAGHMMILTNAMEINKILEESLLEIISSTDDK